MFLKTISYFLLLLSVSMMHGGFVGALSISDAIKCEHDKTLDLDVSQIVVYFYDFAAGANLSFPINKAAEGITQNYKLDVSKGLVFYVPGYDSNNQQANVKVIRQTFKNVPNIYLIVIDHSAYTTTNDLPIEVYETAVRYAYYIGQALGKFLADIHNLSGFPSRNIHVIGHSLGGQMSGYIGTEYTSLTNEKLWRITGIDPAGPCFSNNVIEEQIRSGCAEYVEVYHCSAGFQGTTSVLADTDFFFNFEGKTQPDCLGSLISTKGQASAEKCSHRICVQYYAATVPNPGWFLAKACDSYKAFKSGDCDDHETAVAGYSNPGNATGVFYVSTEPYGKFKFVN